MASEYPGCQEMVEMGRGAVITGAGVYYYLISDRGHGRESASWGHQG